MISGKGNKTSTIASSNRHLMLLTIGRLKDGALPDAYGILKGRLFKQGRPPTKLKKCDVL